MIHYKQFTLSNGLRVLVHEAPNTKLAVMNILYQVGSRDEEANKTGFAHLFEHLMFGGSKNIASFDEPLQKVGGENNAFTNTDITNYYMTVPANNIETAFWLESDRMLSLSFDPGVLEVPRKVVIEEFKQRYLNQPYGDVWLKLRPMAYKIHPYKWATIGKEISHIEEATMGDVKSFFNKYYTPNNAILTVVGGITYHQVVELAEKWFGPLAKGPELSRNIPQEPKQEEKRKLYLKAQVPASAIYKVYHMPGRANEKYYAADLLSDVLGRGKSSRLYSSLVKEKQLFSSISAYVTGSIDPGLLVISGKLNDSTSPEEGEKSIDRVISTLINQEVAVEELEKVKNKAESTLIFSEMELLNRAMNLAYFAFMGDPESINNQVDQIRGVTSEDIQKMAGEILNDHNSSILYYESMATN